MEWIINSKDMMKTNHKYWYVIHNKYNFGIWHKNGETPKRFWKVCMEGQSRFFQIQFNRLSTLAGCKIGGIIDFLIIPYLSCTYTVLLCELFYTSWHIQWAQCRLINKINHECRFPTCQIWLLLNKFGITTNIWFCLKYGVWGLMWINQRRIQDFP